MEKAKFLHVGMTVRDMQKTIEFYTKYFEFELEIQGVFSEDFIGGHNQLYQLPAGAFSDFCFLKSADGIVIEVFRFSPTAESKPMQWNRPGYTHICLKVEDIFDTYERMTADGIEFFFPPDMRGTPEEHWTFLKDPDGNLIEIQDY